jgi:hypothetical protein
LTPKPTGTYFSDAAVLWASFYHVMFKADSTAMKYKTIKAKAQEVSDMYRVRLKLVGHEGDSPRGYKMSDRATHGAVIFALVTDLSEGLLGATRQYLSGKSKVVADRSASVIIHSFAPASVW